MAGTIINLPDHAILSSVGIPNLETSPVFCQQQEGWSPDLGEVEEANRVSNAITPSFNQSCFSSGIILTHRGTFLFLLLS